MRAFSWLSGLDAVERILPWGCIGGLILFAFFPFSPPFLSLLIIISLFSAMWAVGERLVPQAPVFVRPLFGLITLLAAQSILQTAWYYLGGLLTARSDAWTLALPLLGFLLWHTYKPLEPNEDALQSSWPTFLKDARWTIPLLLLGEALLGLIALYAHGVETTTSINSPWPLLPSGVLAVFFLLFVTIGIAAKRTRHQVTTAVLAGTLLLGVSILTPLIYRLGYGFDGFLHRASETVLLTTGTLTPKPPYYLGQYVFVTWMSRLSGINLGIIDRWLVPFFAACLPLFLCARRSQKKYRSLFIFLILFFPLSILSTTTPQAFAYLLGLAALLLAWDRTHHDEPDSEEKERMSSPILSLLLALWALITHPLAGLPLAAMTVGLLWQEWCRSHAWKRWVRIFGLICCGLAASFGVPLAFVLHSHVSAYRIDWHGERLLQSETWQRISDVIFNSPNAHLALWPDWTDALNWFTRVFLVLGITIALWKRRSDRSTLLFLTFGSIGLCIAGLVLAQTGEFSFLIDYERGNYAERLFLLALLIILPVAMVGWNVLWERLAFTPPLLTTFWIIFLAAMVSGQVYNALPRQDAGAISHGWSVGASDVEAVRFIERDAQNKPYTVLANQSVSAAAVSQLGFKRYKDNVFFYPIPTGGPLYALFEQAISEPSLELIKQASILGGTSRVYLVLNRYWTNADQVQQKLESFADRAWSVREGEVIIFQFNVTSTSSTR